MKSSFTQQEAEGLATKLNESSFGKVMGINFEVKGTGPHVVQDYEVRISGHEARNKGVEYISFSKLMKEYSLDTLQFQGAGGDPHNGGIINVKKDIDDIVLKDFDKNEVRKGIIDAHAEFAQTLIKNAIKIGQELSNDVLKKQGLDPVSDVAFKVFIEGKQKQ